MRTFEILLLTADGLTFLMVIFSFYRSSRLAGCFAVVAVLLGVVQMAIEGPRWQLYPAYLLTGLNFIIWILLARPIKNGAVRCARKHRVMAVFVFAVSAAVLVIAIALPLALPVFAFPTPSGSYAIGTVTYHWTDTGRLEVFGTVPRKSRELMVQIWYPAKVSTYHDHYVDDADVLATAQGRLYGLPAFTFAHLKYVKTNASPSALVSANQPNYPVLIFLEGITGYRQMNTFQVEELVSQGYIVVAIDQPYVAASVVFPGRRAVGGLLKEQMDPLIRQSISPSVKVPTLNGRTFANGIIPYLAEDISFVIDQLAAVDSSDETSILRGKLDMQRVGVFGVSLGGIVVGEACHSDLRLMACLAMDAPMSATVRRSGLRQPTMWITRDAKTMRLEGWSEPDIVQHQTTMRSAFERSQGDGYFVSIAGMFHANLTDVPLYSPLTSRLGITGPIDSQRAHLIINAYSRVFFDRHLQGKPAFLLDRSRKPFAEVTLEKSPPRAKPSPLANGRAAPLQTW